MRWSAVILALSCGSVVQLLLLMVELGEVGCAQSRDSSHVTGSGPDSGFHVCWNGRPMMLAATIQGNTKYLKETTGLHGGSIR